MIPVETETIEKLIQIYLLCLDKWQNWIDEMSILAIWKSKKLELRIVAESEIPYISIYKYIYTKISNSN